jgi:hypothetical protein
MVKQQKTPCLVHLGTPELVKLATDICADMSKLIFPGPSSDTDSLHLRLVLPGYAKRVHSRDAFDSDV